MVNKRRLVALTQDLIRINSENPSSDEAQIALYVKRYFQRLGCSVKTYEFRKRRTNVVAVLKGASHKRSLLLSPHLDTVPQGKSWTYPAFQGLIQGDKIYGLGATDCKGNLAAGMEAIASLVEEKVKLGYSVIFAATADEESGSECGLIPLLDRGILKPDAALILDADDFQVIVAQKGLMHLTCKVTGKKAHGAYPWLGINAIDRAVAVLTDLKKEKFPYRRNKYLRPPTVNTGTIKGGDKVNVVANWCEFELDFRFLPGTSAGTIQKKFRRVLNKNAPGAEIQVDGIQQPYEISEKHPLVVSLGKAMRSLGVRPMLSGSEGATVITFFQDKGIPAIATGFGVEGCAHTADEFARINDLYAGARIVERFLKEYRF